MSTSQSSGWWNSNVARNNSNLTNERKKMTINTTIYVNSEKEAREKIREWNKDKKNLIIHSATPAPLEGYNVSYSYED